MGELYGCSIYFNRFLSEIGLSYVFECTGDLKLSSPRDFMYVASNASLTLSELLGLSFSVYSLEHWEYIGKRFNLYAFNLGVEGIVIGQVRVVESGGYMVNVSGALSDYISRVLREDVLEELRDGRRLSIGYNMGITMLRGGRSRWPSGQKAIGGYVIYAAEGIPNVSGEHWSIRVVNPRGGSVEFSLEDLEGRAIEFDERDFHCVTGWSVKGNKWYGVRIADIAMIAGVSGDAKWVLARSVGGYSTIIPVEEAYREDSIIAMGLNGGRLKKENGGPARLIIPRLYGWKSAKWLKEMIFLEDYIDGYWEALAYHERGLVEVEERFKIRNPWIAERGELPENPRPLKPSSI